MNDSQWRQFFRVSAEVLGEGASHPMHSHSWCLWTTFTFLEAGDKYAASGCLNLKDILDERPHIRDNSPWGNPVAYADIAHIVIPRKFLWNNSDWIGEDWSRFQGGEKFQDLPELSARLQVAGIDHHLTDIVLEIKLY